MEIATADEVQLEEMKYPTRPGRTHMQRLLSCETKGGFAIRLIRSIYQGDDDAFQTPRHHHAFQQIRFAEKGNLNYAPGKDISEGEIAYFPKGTYYGPQLRDHGTGITAQFGFGKEMLGGKEALEVYRAGVEKLRSLGVVGNGVFIDVDPETGQQRTRDTWQAVAEEVTGERFDIPEGRYADPILMHPGAFSYFSVDEGVERKNLGVFYEHSGQPITISMLKICDGGQFGLASQSSQLVWCVDSGLKVDGKTYPAITALFCGPDECATLSAQREIELYLVDFPSNP